MVGASSQGLDPAPELLGLEPPFPGLAAGPRPAPGLVPVQCLAEQGGKPGQDLFPVGPLTAPLVGMEEQDPPAVDPAGQPVADHFFLFVGEDCGRIDVKAECDPGVDLIHVLAAAARAAGKGEQDLGERNAE